MNWLSGSNLARGPYFGDPFAATIRDCRSSSVGVQTKLNVLPLFCRFENETLKHDVLKLMISAANRLESDVRKALSDLIRLGCLKEKEEEALKPPQKVYFKYFCFLLSNI